jgi:hypothetical protein
MNPPPMTHDQAVRWLHAAVASWWDEPAVVEAAPVIERIAAAMTAVGAAEVPADVEPLPLSLLQPESLRILDG